MIRPIYLPPPENHFFAQIPKFAGSAIVPPLQMPSKGMKKAKKSAKRIKPQTGKITNQSHIHFTLRHLNVLLFLPLAGMRPKLAGGDTPVDAVHIFLMDAANDLHALQPELYVLLPTYTTPEERAAFNPKVQPYKKQYACLCMQTCVL